MLLVVRFVLMLGNANSASGVVATIYGITDPLVRPFIGVFPRDRGFQAGGPSFPASGCWEVTYRLDGRDDLRFVLKVSGPAKR